PAAAVSNRDVIVSWTATSFPTGTPVSGYEVRRYDASSGALQAVNPGCSGTLSGLSCTETAVPPGSWRYAVAPRHGSWLGLESALGPAVTVAPPALTPSSSGTVSALPASLDAALGRFIPGQSVTFRLDDASTGAVLAATVTPGTIPANGDATASITLPKGTSDGTHTIFAVGNRGDVASATVSVGVPRPTPQSLALINGGQASRIGTGDRIEVTYSERLDVASMCSTWSGDLADQSIASDNAVTVTIADDAAPSGNDLLSVTTGSGACGGQFRFGQVDLGSTAYVGGNTSFAGAGASRSLVDWDATAFKLTVTLGARATGTNPARVTAAATAIYTPDPAIMNVSGRTITGTTQVTAVHF
ncbi:MAG: hypothetical protein ACRDJ5_04195, partial [Actinomycetota bacterium]